MVSFVFLLGAIAILLGVGAIMFGIPINEFGLGNTLIVAGTTTMSAGFVVLALAAVLRAIERIGRRLPQAIAASSEADKEAVRRRAAPPPTERDGAADEWPRPEPIPPVRTDVPPREGLLMPAAAGRPPWSRARDEAPRTGAPVGHAEQGAASAQEPYAEQGREPSIDARLEREPEMTEPPESHDAIHADRREEPPAKAPERRRFFAWTRRSSAAREAAGEPAEPPAEPSLSESVARAEAARQRDRADREAIRRMARQAVERPGREARAEPVAEDQVVVLKSGTVGDMAYTLYTDGSIDAEFANGKIRFESIEHLRRHLEEQGS